MLCTVLCTMCARGCSSAPCDITPLPASPCAPSQGNGAAAEDQLVRAQATEAGWGDMRWIEEHTRWPPRLLQVMRSFLELKVAG